MEPSTGAPPLAPIHRLLPVADSRAAGNRRIQASGCTPRHPPTRPRELDCLPDARHPDRMPLPRQYENPLARSRGARGARRRRLSRSPGRSGGGPHPPDGTAVFATTCLSGRIRKIQFVKELPAGSNPGRRRRIGPLAGSAAKIERVSPPRSGGYGLRVLGDARRPAPTPTARPRRDPTIPAGPALSPEALRDVHRPDPGT